MPHPARSLRIAPIAVAALLLHAPLASGQFVDDFDDADLSNWETLTGDGEAQLRFVPAEGHAEMRIDATADPHNVWWSIIKTDVAPQVDMALLQEPDYELRVSARVRVSHAPRRLNMMVNTPRTTDYHVDLREFDVDQTGEWRVISMTTSNLQVVVGEPLFVQLCATDWGHARYQVDVDWYRAEVIHAPTAGPEQGEPLVYHPPLPELTDLQQVLPVAHDSLINARFPQVNFNDWRAYGSDGAVSQVLTISADQWALLRWDFGELAGARAAGAGIVEFTTHSIMCGGDYVAAYGEDLGVEFGKIRVIEVLQGDPAWEQSEVTYASYLQGQPYEAVFNSQMTFDLALTEGPAGKSYATLPRPVLQRLLDGTTRGLLLRPLGAIEASIYASENAQPGRTGPVLRFNVASAAAED